MTDCNPDREKLKVPITFTEVGMKILRRLVVSSKQSSEIAVMDVGRVTDTNDVHLKKAAFDTEVTLLGIMTETNDKHLEKATSIIALTLVGITTVTRPDS